MQVPMASRLAPKEALFSGMSLVALQAVGELLCWT